MKIKNLFLVFCLIAGMGYAQAPLVLQPLDYTENPVDIPNPDRGPYRGRWQRVDTPFGDTPEVDHRIPVDENSVLYHGATLIAPGTVGVVYGDDIEETQFYNGQNLSPNYVGGIGVSALPSIAFMGFDLCNFSSNAFLSRQAGLDFRREFLAAGGVSTPAMFAGRTGKTQPLTQFALDYVRNLLQKVREGNGVAFVKFSYDGNGYNFIERGELTLIYGPEPTYITPNNVSAMCDVPGHTDKDWIEYHLWQLKPILYEYEDIIMCVKTGMLGPWGEQHTSSKARDPMAYAKMLAAYVDAVPASRSLLTHAGGFLAWYNHTYGTGYSFYDIDKLSNPPEDSPEARFGWFNDSYAGGYVRINQYAPGPTSGANGEWGDNYSFSEGGRMFTPDWNIPLSYSDYDASEKLWWGITTYGFDRYRILDWIYGQNQFCQGEGGLSNHVFGNMPGAILEAQKLRTSNLNMRHGNYTRWNNFIYNEANVSRPVTFPKDNTEYITTGEGPTYGVGYTGETKTVFFDPVYDGRTGLEYMRDRMGYRLVLREAKASEWVERNGALRFSGKIQNVGFGNVINRKRVSVVLKSKTGTDTYSAVTDLDARDWLTAKDGNSRADHTTAWRDLNFSINMGVFGNVPAGEYDIYLKINDPKETSANRRCIRFANKGNRWNADLGANLIGSTTVK